MVQHRDFILIQGWLAGNSASGEKIVSESYEKVLRFVACKIDQRTGNFQQTIEDITAEAFTRAFEKIQDYNGSSSFYTWVCGYARYCIKEKLRSIYKELKQFEFMDENEYFGDYEYDDFDDPEEFACKKEEYEAVRNAFLSLQDDYKEIMHFRLIKGLRYNEIADLSGKSVDNLESLFRRALKAFKNAFEKFYKNS